MAKTCARSCNLRFGTLRKRMIGSDSTTAATIPPPVSKSLTTDSIGAKSCGEYLSAVSDHAPGTSLTVKQADVDYFDAATVRSEWLVGFMPGSKVTQ
jgi:hypothetical protein